MDNTTLFLLQQEKRGSLKKYVISKEFKDPKIAKLNADGWKDHVEKESSVLRTVYNFKDFEGRIVGRIESKAGLRQSYEIFEWNVQNGQVMSAGIVTQKFFSQFGQVHLTFKPTGSKAEEDFVVLTGNFLGTEYIIRHNKKIVGRVKKALFESRSAYHLEYIHNPHVIFHLQLKLIMCVEILKKS